MFLSIIIATYNRLASLDLLLSSIAAHFVPSIVDHEIIVANNAREPGVAIRIDELVQKFQRDCGTRFRLVREPKAGKCRAQYAAIGVARGEILAFFDDDIVVTPSWL